MHGNSAEAPVAGLTRGEPATGVSAPVLLSKLQAEMPLLIPTEVPEGSNVIEELPQPLRRSRPPSAPCGSVDGIGRRAASVPCDQKVPDGSTVTEDALKEYGDPVAALSPPAVESMANACRLLPPATYRTSPPINRQHRSRS